MLPTLGLLKAVACPELPRCQRVPCPFSHAPAPKPSPSRLSSGEPVTKRPRIEPPASPSRPVATNGPPRLEGGAALASHTPVKLRNEILKLLYDAFLDRYSLLPNRVALAHQHSTDQERAVYSTTTKVTYKNTASQALVKVRKRERPSTDKDTTVGLNDAVEQRAKAVKAMERDETDRRINLDDEMLEMLSVASAPAIALRDYVLEIPTSPGGDVPNQLSASRKCARCQQEFLVKAVLSTEEKHACRYHWGRLRTDRTNTPPRRIYSCCGTLSPCSFGPHVFVDEDAASLHRRAAFLATPSLAAASPVAILGIDCELIYTTAGLSLARVTAVVPESDTALLDEHVRPAGTVLDCNTRFSGIASADQLAKMAVLDLAGVQRALGTLIGKKTVLVGHGLENDLKALRLVHPPERCIDTAIIYPHPSGLPFRHSLRQLVKTHLGTFIQDEGTHDSAIDAKAALDLVRLKVKARGGMVRSLV